MNTARWPIILALLTSCANTVSGVSVDAALDSPLSDGATPDDLGALYDAAADQTDATFTDPRCPQRPCLSAPLIRAANAATWLAYPDGRTWVWGTWGPEVDSSGQHGVRYATPTAGPTLSDDILDIASAQFHACALATHPRRVECWGSNEAGELGRGTVSPIEPPATVPGLSEVDAIGVFGRESWALTSSTAYLWGGSLTAGARLLSGPSPRAFSSPPHALRFPTGAPLYAWGYLTSDGQIYALGQNDYGAVGIDVDAAITTPTRVPGLSPVVDYSTGPFASCAVLAGGEVYCWGRRRGFLEHNDQPPVSTAVPERVVGIDDAVRVHVGSNLACALTRTRGVRCWGRVNWDRREAGATTDDPTSPPGATMELPPVRELAVGEHHACALTMNDEVYCWGANDLGQLGIARFGSDSTTPRRVLLPR